MANRTQISNYPGALESPPPSTETRAWVIIIVLVVPGGTKHEISANCTTLTSCPCANKLKFTMAAMGRCPYFAIALES